MRAFKLVFITRTNIVFTLLTLFILPKISRWAYGGQEEIGHNVDYASLDWFVDPCWRRVYSHSEAGDRVKVCLPYVLLFVLILSKHLQAKPVFNQL